MPRFCDDTNFHNNLNNDFNDHDNDKSGNNGNDRDEWVPCLTSIEILTNKLYLY